MECWHEVLKYNSDFELAYVGIGKAYLADGDNVKAMEYLRLGMDKDYYSIAYKRWRNEILSENLPWILTTGVVVVAVLVTGSIVKNHRRRKGGDRG